MSPTKWELKSAASREALLHSAMHAFHDRGFASTRVQDIVDGAGHTSGAFYFHFKDKTDCFWHVLDYRQRLRGNLIDALDGLGPQTTSLEDAIRYALGAISTSMAGVESWILVMVDFSLQHRGDAQVADRLHDVYVGLHGEVMAIVGALQAGGWVSADRDPALLASEVFAFVQGLTVHADVFGIAPDERATILVDGLARLLGESAACPTPTKRQAVRAASSRTSRAAESARPRSSASKRRA